MDMGSVLFMLLAVLAFLAMILVVFPLVMFIEWFKYWRGTDKSYWDLLKEEW